MIQSRHYHPGRLRPVRLIVIHTMESPEKPGTALAVALWFAGPAAPQASAHWCIDDHDVIPCVNERDTAWAAPGANADGVQLEHAGRAGQGPAGWADAYSRAVLANSARVAAAVSARHGIPIRHLSDEQLAAGHAGFVEHAQVSRVYKRSDHTDPGDAWPWGSYLRAVRDSLTPVPPPILTEDAMTPEERALLVRELTDAVTSIRARNPVLVDEGTGAADLPDGRDIDALPTVVGELQHEQRRQGETLARHGVLLAQILDVLARLEARVPPADAR